MYNDPLTSQNSSAIGTSLSGIIFNLVSLLKNERTPPFSVELQLSNIEYSEIHRYELFILRFQKFSNQIVADS